MQNTATHTTRKSNNEFEKKHQDDICRAITGEYSGLLSIILVTRKDYQVRGVDFAVDLDDGSRRFIDAKVRRFERCPWKIPADQDIIIEITQGRGVGWALTPNALTQDVLYVWPGIPEGFARWIRVSYAFCREVAMRATALEAAGIVSRRKAYNGKEYAEFVCIPIRDILNPDSSINRAIVSSHNQF